MPPGGSSKEANDRAGGMCRAQLLSPGYRLGARLALFLKVSCGLSERSELLYLQLNLSSSSLKGRGKRHVLGLSRPPPHLKAVTKKDSSCDLPKTYPALPKYVPNW